MSNPDKAGTASAPACARSWRTTQTLNPGTAMSEDPTEYNAGPSTAGWRCACGATPDPTSADWRWTGRAWEHHHGGQAGHFRAVYTPPEPGPRPEAAKFHRDSGEYPLCDLVADYNEIELLERELSAAQARIAELESALEAERRRTAEELNCQQGMHAMEVARLQLRVEELEAELESHAWEISPAMAQAKIDQLNAQIAELIEDKAMLARSRETWKKAFEAAQPPAPQFLERPDAAGWWWCLYAGKPRIGEARMEWRQDESGKQLVWWSGLGFDADKINVVNLMGSKWVRATPPQWTPSEEGAK